MSSQTRTVDEGRAHAEFLRSEASEIEEPAMNLDEVELDAEAAHRLAIGSAEMIDGLCNALENATATAHRVTMERDGARLSLDAAQASRIKQSLELADARAEVVRLTARVATLESLATGPRSLTIDAAACDAIDGGATAGPRHDDATGREVLP